MMSLNVSLSEIMMTEVFASNITHNLTKMAEEAGIYKYLWRPEEIIHSPVIHAYQLIRPLEDGLSLLQSDPERFKQFDASNKWGVYKDFVRFVEEYLAGCKEHPAAEVSISR